MPDFSVDDIEINPGEYVYACNKREIAQLIDELVEEGHISPERRDGGADGVRRPNINDVKFWESLDKLAKCRDLLSIKEENFINSLADKFKHLR